MQDGEDVLILGEAHHKTERSAVHKQSRDAQTVPMSAAQRESLGVRTLESAASARLLARLLQTGYAPHPG